MGVYRVHFPLEVAKRIQALSKENTVIIGSETTQGVVRARHKGNIMVKDFAQKNNLNPSSFLILQSDADTIYSEGYPIVMRDAALSCGYNFIFESIANYPKDFTEQNKDYSEQCSAIDAKYFELFLMNPSDDIIIDDKTAGYWLKDYFLWGGHQEEHTAKGEEIFSETTRLFIRAKAYGAKRVLVTDAFASHSPRKIFSNPALHFATAGFPREKLWNRQFLSMPETSSLDSFTLDTVLTPEVRRMRELHLIAIFSILPLHVNKAMKASDSFNEAANAFYKKISHLLPKRVYSDLINQPGLMLSDVFNVIAIHGELVLKEAHNYIKNTSP